MNASEEHPMFFDYIGLEDHGTMVTIFEKNGRLIHARKEVVKVAPSIKRVKLVGAFSEQ